MQPNMSFMDFTSPMESAAAAERLPGAGPLPVVMNWEERARRAEALADHLSLCAAKMVECASECGQHGHAGSLTREMVDRYHASRRYTENALARWASHRADLDTLEQEAAR